MFADVHVIFWLVPNVSASPPLGVRTLTYGSGDIVKTSSLKSNAVVSTASVILILQFVEANVGIEFQT